MSMDLDHWSTGSGCHPDCPACEAENPFNILKERQDSIAWKQFFKGYIQALGFSGRSVTGEDDDNDGPAFEGSGDFDSNWDVWEEIKGKIDREDLQQIIDDIDGFLESADDLIRSDEKRGDDHERAGTDFCFTRNGEGAGFWDGDWSNGDELTDLSKPYGTFSMEVQWDEGGKLLNVWFHG